MSKITRSITPKVVRKQTRTAVAKAAKKHFPAVKAAAEKALRAAGLPHLDVHAMTFSVSESAVADQCDPPCAANEVCRLSSTGNWMCMPKP